MSALFRGSVELHVCVCIGVGEREKDNEGGSDTVMAALPHSFSMATDKQLAGREVPAAGCVLIGRN